MAAQDDSESFPRPISNDERRVLDYLLSVDFDGVEELREQAEVAKVTGRCECGCPSVTLSSDPSGPRKGTWHGVYLIRAQGDEEQTTLLDDLMLFVDAEGLGDLEVGWYGDKPPRSWPSTAGRTLQVD